MISSIILTESAAKRMKEIVLNSEGAVGIRITVKPKGCMGLAYDLSVEYDQELSSPIDSECYQDKGVVMYLDKKAVEFLSGTKIDFVEEGFRSEFVFDNPNAKNKCNCGISFCV